MFASIYPWQVLFFPEQCRYPNSFVGRVSLVFKFNLGIPVSFGLEIMEHLIEPKQDLELIWSYSVLIKQLNCKCSSVLIYLSLSSTVISEYAACGADSSMFPCNNGECIPSTWKCDGEYDCRDRSDDVECQGMAKILINQLSSLRRIKSSSVIACHVNIMAIAGQLRQSFPSKNLHVIY